ncbi:MAG: 3-hydroxyacyl-ACP dehydratase FabZ [Caenispirillum bisanense]|uniref:3-hydroxyacyl-[acyl-carrier-protein] dehydratase FabZ n=1 Tax=Caenispirillum bisanense TaxID=414052 RepID=A0A286H2H3_9PROT|nr:3-hydroxyacyl-ACP dehydratase FabZ [Caenispirillum bisanense]MCA1941578.1 3-hydroxyacyl-ACP dehydratase FabZ [Caenispirillum bisanense]MCA1974740.1 3-hydroxyacyl-ACP dehydratase FabZ [Caenispirillum sp.]SOE01646.1 3-hydroxyacyl-[acyl-carrier-protein] dehydratase [Caenispirillum bisanense]
MDATSDKTEATTEGTTIGIERIMKMIPHRYPMLLIDRVVDVHKNERCVGIKNVSMNEPFFQGHFPQRPVMPGVLIIEAMAQTAAVLVVETLGPDSEGKLVYFMSVDNARFRKPVVPGDRLELHVSKEHSRRNVWKFRAEGKVDGKVVAEATYAAMILDD